MGTIKQILELTEEKFQDIYTDESFRNNVAFAHICMDKDGTFKHRKTCSYPIEYIVTPEQIRLAALERERAKIQVLADNPNTLIFVGMGMTYEPTENNNVGNFRIRTEIKNNKGRRFFIELGKGTGLPMRCDHSIDRDLEDKCDRAGTHSQPYNNYAGIERAASLGNYTLDNVLKTVNKAFDCNFSKVIIDNYNLSTGDYISISI